MRSFLTPFISILFLHASMSHAEAVRWYQVEVALVAYQNEAVIDHENWPDLLLTEEPEAKEDAFGWLDWWNKPAGEHALYAVHPKTTGNAAPLARPFVTSGIAFEDKINKIERRKDMQVVWSDKWQQPIDEQKHSTGDDNQISINLRKPFNSQKDLDIEVTGSFYLYRSRYLHIVTDLQVQHWQHLGTQQKLDKALNTPLCTPEHKANIVPSKNATQLTAVCEVPIRAAKIEQSRRMRSRELHYVDHPMLGIMVRAIPIEQLPENQPAN